MNPSRDLRNSTRYALRRSVTLRLGSKKYRGETLDISANGVLVHTDCPIVTGSSIHFTIELPGDAFGIETFVKVNCQGRVVRCLPGENNDGQDVGIVIDDYHFQPPRKLPVRKTA